MTYCVGLLLDEGLVFASDSRTNAGVDSIATYKKTRVFEIPGERVIVFLSAGNLAVTQSVLSILDEGAKSKKKDRSILKAPTMYQVARLAGEAIRQVHDADAEHLRKHNYDFNATFLLGGQIKGEDPRLFMIYTAGNFIEAKRETPMFQIGEVKYGKPVFDRILTPELSFGDAAKLTLISFDSTMRSNLSVAPPIDMTFCRKDDLRVSERRAFTERDPYLIEIRRRWSEALRGAFLDIPPLPRDDG